MLFVFLLLHIPVQKSASHNLRFKSPFSFIFVKNLIFLRSTGTLRHSSAFNSLLDLLDLRSTGILISAIFFQVLCVFINIDMERFRQIKHFNEILKPKGELFRRKLKKMLAENKVTDTRLKVTGIGASGQYWHGHKLKVLDSMWNRDNDTEYTLTKWNTEHDYHCWLPCIWSVWKDCIDQGFGSGSVSGSGSALIWVVGSGSGSGSRRGKRTHKNRKKYRIFMFWSAGCPLLRAEGFSCSLSALYGGLGINKWQFLIKKIKIKFPAVNFFQF
jgi:hypothetical protein